MDLNKVNAAIRSLERLGYTYHSGEYWEPPPGPLPSEANPHGFLCAKLEKVIPVLQEARDAITHLTKFQVIVHNISPSLAVRMDEAGAYTVADWWLNVTKTS